VRYHVRDNQGYYLADTNRDSFILLEPELKHTTLFYSEEVIAERLTYYMIWNHLASVIDRLAADTLLNEEVAIALLHEWCQVRVENLEGRGRAWLLMLLESPTLPYKANLLTRLQGLDELEVEGERVCFVDLDNPLREGNYALRQQNTHLQTTS
ncbi:MAG: ferric iron reductase, partial [Exiguobacterium acetylicum]